MILPACFCQDGKVKKAAELGCSRTDRSILRSSPQHEKEKQMGYIITILIAFLVPVVLNVLTAIASRNTTDSIYHFTMKPTKAILIIGWPCTILFLVCIIGSNMAGKFTGWLAWVFSIMFIVGVILVLTPVKGFYDTVVDGDIMTSTRLWLIKKTISIKDISYCTRTQNGISVYVKNSDKKALLIDGLSTNLSNFMERMQVEGIEVR